MRPVPRLEPEALRLRCDPTQFHFQTTAELPDLHSIIGQPRAVAAVRFGIGIEREGYNIFAYGHPGTGKHSLVQRFLKQAAAEKALPPDWCYVHNFKAPAHPRALALPPGTAAVLERDMARLVAESRAALLSAFESAAYHRQRQAIDREFGQRPERAATELQRRAQEHGLTLITTPTGPAVVPMTDDGEPVHPSRIDELPEPARTQLRSAIEEIEEELTELTRLVPLWQREQHARLRDLGSHTIERVVAPMIEELQERYAALPEVLLYLAAVQEDMVNTAEQWVRPDQPQVDQPSQVLLSRPLDEPAGLRRYQVNVLVNRSGESGAPVVYEDNPTLQNLIGRLEHLIEMGALVTDFNLIRPGALHRANGGYLIVDAHKLLQHEHAWDALKRALRAEEIRIEPPGQAQGVVSTMTLEPEAIPLDIKVVLLGDRGLYYHLGDHDPDFRELFKVAADFDDVMDRTPENVADYVRLIATIARREELRALDRAAGARVIERSARLTGDAQKLSTHMRAITDLLTEADYWARHRGAEIITADDVRAAIEAQVDRADRVRDHLHEDILRGTRQVETDGVRVGQVNALSVIQFGTLAFGQPTRLSAQVGLGKGEVVNIEREVELSGPIHSKGVLILSGLLRAIYGAERPLSLAASLVFEQSYTHVDGDSASLAEMCALLSAIAGAPLRQSLAVTGAISQHGDVQAVGGVNEKIEGFFDICRARGLTGKQGVLIPAANVKNLMLRPDVVEAAAQGRFHVYPIERLEQALELLAGIPAGERDETGQYPEDSLNRMVTARLSVMAETMAALHAGTD